MFHGKIPENSAKIHFLAAFFMWKKFSKSFPPLFHRNSLVLHKLSTTLCGIFQEFSTYPINSLILCRNFMNSWYLYIISLQYKKLYYVNRIYENSFDKFLNSPNFFCEFSPSYPQFSPNLSLRICY